MAASRVDRPFRHAHDLRDAEGSFDLRDRTGVSGEDESGVSKKALSTIGRQRILVIDDDGAVCGLLDEVLREDGYDVECVTTDEAAYARLRTDWRSIDALVVDINLGPGTTGFDVARFARRLNRSVPVIYITGGSRQSVAAFGVEGSGLVQKPFDRDALIEMLRQKLAA